MAAFRSAEEETTVRVRPTFCVVLELHRVYHLDIFKAYHKNMTALWNILREKKNSHTSSP
jgi:hypothetical protein